MKLRELFEVKSGAVGEPYQQSSSGINLFSDGEKSNGTYTMYRLGMALACSDGTTPIQMDPKSWYGKRHTAHPFTSKEQDMLIQSYKVVGAKYEDCNKGDLRSQELESTNIVSPVAKPKKNKYGI